MENSNDINNTVEPEVEPIKEKKKYIFGWRGGGGEGGIMLGRVVIYFMLSGGL